MKSKMIGLCLLLSIGLNCFAQKVIKIGTLAPKSSPWGRVLEVWANSVDQKSGGKLKLEIFYNGNQGDEAAMIAKIKSGQLDGALVSSVGLAKVYKPLLSLEMPGLFKTWAQLDKARNAMNSEFIQGMTDAGFTLGGWVDFGIVRAMSKGFALNLPTSLKGKKPYMNRDNDITARFFQTIGGFTPTPLNVPEVLPNLNTGAINVVLAPALFAEQLQWSSKLDNLCADMYAYSVGGIIFSNNKLDSLNTDIRNILTGTAKIAASSLTTSIRNEDERAFTRLKSKMTVLNRTATDQAKWDAIYKQTRQKLAQGTFSQDLVSKLEKLGGR